ncbi:MAG: hypothetical protein ACLPSW_11320 [Roseiarcus sp.]
MSIAGLALGDAWSARGGIPNQASHRAEAHGTKRETGIPKRDSNVRLIDDADFSAFALWLRQRRSTGVSLIDIEQFNSFAGRLLRGVGELAELGAIIDVRRAFSFISVE